MKRKCLTLGAGIGIAAMALTIWLLNRPEILGNINHSFSASEPASDTSTISFLAEEGDQIRLYFASEIERGDLEIIVYDSAGDLVENLDKAKELVTYLTMDHADTYILAAQYKDFAGNFKVIVSKVD